MSVDENGTTNQTTLLGAFVTLLLYTVVIVYAFQQIEIMIGKGKVDIVAATQEDYFTADDSFGADQGLSFAIAFSSQNDNFEYELQPEMGSIVFTVSKWGFDENGELKFTETPLESHVCSLEELHLTEDTSNAKFYKPHE